MSIFYGSFQAAFEALAAGAHGWISSILNVAPIAARQMYQEVVVNGNVHRGFEIWKRILPLVHLYTHSQVGPVSDLAIYRSILNLWGLNGGYCRNPFYPLSSEEEKRLQLCLKQANWLEPWPA
jgi:dihydrodipicolinate synthase/N-acetylneuraminate lyase